MHTDELVSIVAIRVEGIGRDVLAGAQAQVTLLGSGAILTEVVKAARQLAAEGIVAEVFSVTSWSELARDGAACEARALEGQAEPGTPFIARQLAGGSGPVIAATDYVRALWWALIVVSALIPFLWFKRRGWM